MPHIEEQIEIAVARVDVFKFCHDVKQRTKWDEQVEYIEVLTQGPMRQGALLRIDARQGNSVFSWDAEVAEYHLPQQSQVKVLDVASTSPFGRGSYLIWKFDSVGAGTQLTWIWNYQANGWIARIMNSLGRQAATHRMIKRSLANLKQALESGARAGAQR